MIEKCMEKWVNRLIEIEGMKVMPYKNVMGDLCIGVGRCLTEHPLSVAERKALGDYMHGITENGAKMLLRNDILRCYALLKKHIKGYDKLGEEKQFVVLYMCFSIGWKKMQKFYNMLRYMGRGNFEMAVYEFLHSDYARQFPIKSHKIALMLKGEEIKKSTVQIKYFK